METKICTKCSEEKMLSEFNKHKNKKDGLSLYCKKCRKQYRSANREKIAEKNAQYYSANREKVAQYRFANREKILEKRAQYRFANREKIKNTQLKYEYGITLEQYNKMAQEQNNVCLICKQEKKLVVDHCHDTGTVRGLLCSECNISIGLLKETPQYFVNAIQYLERYNNRNEERMLG